MFSYREVEIIDRVHADTGKPGIPGKSGKPGE